MGELEISQENTIDDKREEIKRKLRNITTVVLSARILGIRNEDKVNWTYEKADGPQIPVGPGRTAGITKARWGISDKTNSFFLGSRLLRIYVWGKDRNCE